MVKALSEVPPPLAKTWSRARHPLRDLVSREHRNQLDEILLALVARTRVSRPDGLPLGDEHHDLLRIGAQTAMALAPHAPADPELLAVAAALPWFDLELRGIRDQLFDGTELDWPAAMLLAMVPPNDRPAAGAGTGARRYLRQLAALPALLRAAVLIERKLASATPTLIGHSYGRLRPFNEAELAELAPGIPADLIELAGTAADATSGIAAAGIAGVQPVGSPAEAIELAGQHLDDLFAGYLVRPNGNLGYRIGGPGDPGFLVDGAELVYAVRWNLPPELIQQIGPQRSNPGDGPQPAFRAPGWMVDRVTRAVTPVDLASRSPASYVTGNRIYPLPPGWQPTERQSLPDAFAAALARLLTAPAEAEPDRFATAGCTLPALAAALTEATARFQARLTTQTWPDLLVTLRIAERTVDALRAAEVTEPAALIGAVLAARGPAATDTLLDERSPLWQTPAGEFARPARPENDELDGTGATARATRLRTASPAVRALVLANAQARAAVEHDLFGVTPRARRDEVGALEVLTGNAPADPPAPSDSELPEIPPPPIPSPPIPLPPPLPPRLVPPTSWPAGWPTERPGSTPDAPSTVPWPMGWLPAPEPPTAPPAP